MSEEEERELLARIGQLAGQINRHKTQHSGTAHTHQAGRGRRNVYRASNVSGPQYRVGRSHAGHRHRTLHLNQSTTPGSDTSAPSQSSTPVPSGWVAKNDRHRQLINANVYEKDAQNRAKAMEETRQKKIQTRRYREKSQIKEFLRRQAGSGSSVGTPEATASTNSSSRNEITIEGTRFRVTDGGKKLVKSLDDRQVGTPKTALVAGVRFHRTKTGNLVANRIVQDQRRSGGRKKLDQLCRVFSTTGSCSKGPSCRYQHDPSKVALCKDFLKEGKCANGEHCDLSHELSPERVPNCVHFAKGNCTKPDCPYTHSKATLNAAVCEPFGFCGFCEKGADCTERHVFECPDFSNTGTCKTKGCKLLHRERASVLRNQTKADEAMDEDLSSDEERVDSDDVDSDEVAEFIDADSDDSDFEHQKDYIPL